MIDMLQGFDSKQEKCSFVADGISYFALMDIHWEALLAFGRERTAERYQLQFPQV